MKGRSNKKERVTAKERGDVRGKKRKESRESSGDGCDKGSMNKRKERLGKRRTIAWGDGEEIQEWEA